MAYIAMGLWIRMGVGVDGRQWLMRIDAIYEPVRVERLMCSIVLILLMTACAERASRLTVAELHDSGQARRSSSINEGTSNRGQCHRGSRTSRSQCGERTSTTELLLSSVSLAG